MRINFYSDNGSPCYRCNGTIFEYTMNTSIYLIELKCFTCRAVDVFSAPRGVAANTAAECSALHRASR